MMYAADNTGNLVPKGEDSAPFSQFPNLVKFEKRFRNSPENESLNITQKMKRIVKKKISKCDAKKTILNYIPIIDTFRTYDVREYLPNDMIAGLISGVMIIPEGMAFAALATLPPIVGLYISFFASVTYFFIGTGRQLTWGCVAILSLMMANILDKYDRSIVGGSHLTCLNVSLPEGQMTTTTGIVDFIGTKSNESSSDIDDRTRRRMEVASGVTVVVGLIMVLASRIGLSRIAALMSDSLITGFTVGISFHIATSQIKTLLGISVPRYTGPGQLIRTWITLLQHLGDTNVATLIISFVCILVIYLVKRHINERFKKKMRVAFPIELFVIVAATVASYYGYFNRNYDVTIIEDVPIGMPSPKLPDVTLVADYIGDAMVIMIVSYAQSLALAKYMALKHNYNVNIPQEMLACGLCSVVCGLFSGYITGASMFRSLIQDSAQAKTQIASLIAAGLVLLVIMVIGPYFYYLPNCVLSAVIVVNLRTLFLKLLDIPEEWRKSKYDCSIWVFTYIATIVLNADVGLLVGVVFSLFLVVFRSMIHTVEEAGQIQTSAITVQLRSLRNYSVAQQLHNVKILRVKTPLYFINSEIFSASILKEIAKTDDKKTENGIMAGSSYLKEVNLSSKRDVRAEDVSMKRTASKEGEDSTHFFSLKVVILDMSEVSFIDAMGVKSLELLIQQSSKLDKVILFTHIPESLFSMLQSTGFWKKHSEKLFLTIEDALSFLAKAAVTENIISRL